jgi:hypothetical protein
MLCYFGPARRHCFRSPATQNIWARRSDSSASCTPGIRSSSIIHTFTASFRPANWLRIIYGGSTRSRVSSCRSAFSEKCSRGKFVVGLKLHAEHKLAFHGTLSALRNPKTFTAWLRPLFRSAWVVYSKRPFGGAQHALRYLGQYTHRIALANHRLVALDNGIVTFRWRDSPHKNKKRLMMAGGRRVSASDSCCTCCRPDSSASATSGFWRIAAAASYSRSAFDCSPTRARLKPKPDRKEKSVHLHGRFGSVRNAVDPWS